MPRSVAIIGAGQIGFAACYPFLNDGWDVTLYARTEPDWGSKWGHYNRFRRYVAGTDEAPVADVVLDTIAYDKADVAAYDPDRVGRLIAISSASVYCDDEGRTLDEASVNGFPQFRGAIAEDQAIVPPGSSTYSTRKVRMEKAAQAGFGERATILRPCAIHGEKSRHPREWWFVKRLLDGRLRIPLANRGAGRFQTTSAMTIGNAAHFLAANAIGGVFNVQDADSPSVLEIGRAIEYVAEQQVELVEIEGYPDAGVGRTPWSVPFDFVTTDQKLRDAGFAGGLPYQDDVANSVGYLARLAPDDWRAAFPQLAAYPWDLFDYDAEDRFFASL